MATAPSEVNIFSQSKCWAKSTTQSENTYLFEIQNEHYKIVILAGLLTRVEQINPSSLEAKKYNSCQISHWFDEAGITKRSKTESIALSAWEQSHLTYYSNKKIIDWINDPKTTTKSLTCKAEHVAAFLLKQTQLKAFLESYIPEETKVTKSNSPKKRTKKQPTGKKYPITPIKEPNAHKPLPACNVIPTREVTEALSKAYVPVISKNANDKSTYRREKINDDIATKITKGQKLERPKPTPPTKPLHSTSRVTSIENKPLSLQKELQFKLKTKLSS